MNPNWPPLLHDRRLSPWVNARDVALTLLAWTGMAWLMRGFPLRIWELLTDPLSPPLGEQLLSREFLPYVGLAVTLLTALAVFAWRGRARLRAQPSAEGGPPPLDPAVHAASFDLDPQQAYLLRASRVSVLQFGAAGRPVGVVVVMDD